MFGGTSSLTAILSLLQNQRLMGNSVSFWAKLACQAPNLPNPLHLNDMLVAF
jgi:hypothetical protein